MKDIPAFPAPHFDLAENEHGLTMRDYFAAQAMAAVMPAVLSELKKTRGSVKEALRLQDLSAETCYAIADAMLKARND